MQSTKIWVHRQQTKNDAEDDFYWQRTCIPCVAKAEGLTEEDAKLQVLAGPMEHKSKRAHQYKLACESKREEFEAMVDGPSRKERRKLTLASMQELFQPLAAFIIRKHAAMSLVVKDVERHGELVRELAKCKSITQEQAILDEMEKLEVDDKYLAFESKGPEQQHDFILASSYSDEWTEIKNGKGQVVGGICSWYVCRARTGWDDNKQCHAECMSVIPSKDWDRKFEDPLASKQKWYCHCAAKYNATWGQLVELKRVNAAGELERFYMKAEVPTWDAEDVRAMYHEATMDPASPMELYNNVKRVVPTVSNLIVASGSHLEICSIGAWDALPFLQWFEIFRMLSIMPPNLCK